MYSILLMQWQYLNISQIVYLLLCQLHLLFKWCGGRRVSGLTDNPLYEEGIIFILEPHTG